MKYSDINLTRNDYDNHPSNKQGVFRPPLGFIKNAGYDQQNVTEAQLDMAFEVYKSSAFDDIDAFNVQRPLTKLQFNSFATDIQTGIIKAIVSQINNALENGLAEKTNTSSNSTSAFSQTIESTLKINTKGQIDQDTEDALDAIDYRNWKITYDDAGNICVAFGNAEPYASKTANGFALEALTFLEDADLDFPSVNLVKKLIAGAIKGAVFLGVWTAASRAEVQNIDSIFQNNGLTLTNGNVITPANTNDLSTIIVEIPSDLTWKNEEKFLDTTWKPITFNNEEFALLEKLQNDLNNLTSDVTTNTSSITALQAQLQQVITDQTAKNTTYETDIANLRGDVTAASNAATAASNAATAAQTQADNNKADLQEITNAGKIVSDDGDRELVLPNAKATVATTENLDFQEITDLWTNAEKFDKYKNKSVRITIDIGDGINLLAIILDTLFVNKATGKIDRMVASAVSTQSIIYILPDSPDLAHFPNATGKIEKVEAA